MMFNYSKLEGRIIEKFQTRKNFSQQLGISLVSLSNKLNNKRSFTQNEIAKATELLDLTNVEEYFFCVEC